MEISTCPGLWMNDGIRSRSRLMVDGVAGGLRVHEGAYVERDALLLQGK